MYDYNSTKMEIAKYYVSQLNWAVFPCHTIESNGVCSCGNAACGRSAAKHPITENGVKDATKDIETLKQFFTGPYEIANLALATGEPSGVWVLDVDDLVAIQSLENEHGPLPRTPTGETGSGGRHYFFRFTEACADFKNATKFCGALDIRTTGGYVLLPPSVHRTGNAYRWLVSPDDAPIADAPEWLVNLIPKRSPSLTIVRAKTLDERVLRYLEKAAPAISGDSGHAHTFRVVCRLSRSSLRCVIVTTRTSSCFSMRGTHAASRRGRKRNCCTRSEMLVLVWTYREMSGQPRRPSLMPPGDHHRRRRRPRGRMAYAQRRCLPRHCR